MHPNNMKKIIFKLAGRIALMVYFLGVIALLGHCANQPETSVLALTFATAGILVSIFMMWFVAHLIATANYSPNKPTKF